MSRQIKFRGKRKDTGEWGYGYCVITPKGKAYIFCNGDICEVVPETVGQFTGLFDNDSKEIYEGDIIDFGLNAVVKYHPFLCSFILDCDNRELHFNDSYTELGSMKKLSNKFGIIGNIHDNPRLIERR